MIYINGARFKFADQTLVTAMEDMGYRNLNDPNLIISINKERVVSKKVVETRLTDGDRIDVTRIPMREFYL